VAKYTIYKDEEVAQQNEITLSVNPIGTVQGYEGYGFGGLSSADKMKVIGFIGVPLLVLFVLGFVLIRRRLALARGGNPIRVR
jgi:hypothetical protein